MIVGNTGSAALTKRQVVEQAFTECALNGWEYDITPDEKDTALTRLDGLMWELLGRGYNLSYNFPDTIGGGDLDDAIGVSQQAFMGLSVLLALRLCPTMGKTQAKESKLAMADAMKAVIASAATLIPTQELAPGSPIGSGNKPWALRYPYVINTNTITG